RLRTRPRAAGLRGLRRGMSGQRLRLPRVRARHPRQLPPVAHHPAHTPGLQALPIGLIIANPTHIDREHRGLRLAGLALIAATSAANVHSATLLVHALLHGSAGHDPTRLLVTGAQIWLTYVIVFALSYWDFDRGGPVARAIQVAIDRLQVPAKCE